MELIIAELQGQGFEVVKTKTLHSGGKGSDFFQLKKDGAIYPKSRGNKQDVGAETIQSCYNTFGLMGVLNIFDAN